MPSPIAHWALIAAGRPLRRRGFWPANPGRQTIALYALLAFALVLPDFDFAVGILFPGTPLGTHAEAMHSLAVTLGMAVALAAMWWLATRQSPAKVFALLLAALWSHVLMDAVTWGGFGVSLLWPWYGERIGSPVRVFYGVRHGESVRHRIDLHMITLVTELAFAAVVYGVARFFTPPRPAVEHNGS